MENYKKLIWEYSGRFYKNMTREAQGELKYPFIVPGSGSYCDCLWDWDSWLTDVAVRQIMLDRGEDQSDFFEYEKGCILNFLEHAKSDGRIPIFLTEKGSQNILEENSQNMHKPCLAQHAAFVVKSSGMSEWLQPYFLVLKSFLDCYYRNFYHEETGLYFWIDDGGIGVDNDPCTFYRPNRSSASIYLNCLMYKELEAMVYLSKMFGEDGEKYQSEASNLKQSIQTWLWDEKDGFYYSADLNLRPVDYHEKLHGNKPRHWPCLIQRIGVWSGFMAMWAGIATPEQAKRMVEDNIRNSDTFWAEYGVRTLSKMEKMYCIEKSGNPSCWLGPIWGISNYMCFRGLINYGFEAEAKELADKTVRLFGKDIQKCGEMHEYYHPDTGEGVNNPGFQNWNLLVNNIIAWMEQRRVVKEF